MRVSLLLLLLGAGVCGVCGQDNSGTDTDINYCEVLGGAFCQTQAESGSPAAPAAPFVPPEGLYQTCPCPDGSQDHCECVNYWQCDNDTGAYDFEGKSVIELGKRNVDTGCRALEFRCCKISSSDAAKMAVPTPHPNYPTPAPPLPTACGVRHLLGVNSRIANSEDGEAGFGEFPWMVALFLDKPPPAGSRRVRSDKYLCGGALISPEVVLTVAHCVNGKLPRWLRARAGEWNRASTTESFKHQDRNVRKVAVHDSFDGGSLRHDLALLFLDSPVVMAPHIGTVCLPEVGDGTAFEGEACIVTGWGRTHENSSAPHDILKRLDLALVPHAECEAKQVATGELREDFTLHQSFICAGGEQEKDTCKGDGGSPLVCPLATDAARFQVVGAVAWGVGCGRPNLPSMYTNVALDRPWIDKKLAEEGISLSGGA